MASFLDLCEKYFDSRNFYEILKIEKTADEKDVKKAYHKLSLLVHPDRVNESDKIEATEKFKVLGKIHSVLSDKDKRAAYDETGQYEDDSDENAMRDWTAYWRLLFKKITVEDIDNYEKNYKNSETELHDLKRAYLGSKGNMDFILESVPFTSCDDEPRLIEIVKKWIDAGEVPEYKCFINEPKARKLKRRRKWEKEAEEAARMEEAAKLEMEDDMAGDGDDQLALLIQKKQEERGKLADTFFDMLAEKYGGEKGTKKRKSSAGNKASPKRKAPVSKNMKASLSKNMKASSVKGRKKSK